MLDQYNLRCVQHGGKTCVQVREGHPAYKELTDAGAAPLGEDTGSVCRRLMQEPQPEAVWLFDAADWDTLAAKQREAVGGQPPGFCVPTMADFAEDARSGLYETDDQTSDAVFGDGDNCPDECSDCPPENFKKCDGSWQVLNEWAANKLATLDTPGEAQRAVIIGIAAVNAMKGERQI